MSEPFCARCIDETEGLLLMKRRKKPAVLLCPACREPLAELREAGKGTPEEPVSLSQLFGTGKKGSAA